MNKIYIYCLDNLDKLFNDEKLRNRFMIFRGNKNDIQFILDKNKI